MRPLQTVYAIDLTLQTIGKALKEFIDGYETALHWSFWYARWDRKVKAEDIVKLVAIDSKEIELAIENIKRTDAVLDQELQTLGVDYAIIVKEIRGERFAPSKLNDGKNFNEANIVYRKFHIYISRVRRWLRVLRITLETELALERKMMDPKKITLVAQERLAQLHKREIAIWQSVKKDIQNPDFVDSSIINEAKRKINSVVASLNSYIASCSQRGEKPNQAYILGVAAIALPLIIALYYFSLKDFLTKWTVYKTHEWLGVPLPPILQKYWEQLSL